MKRKILSLLLAALMICSLCPTAIASEQTVPVKLTADEPAFSVTLPTSIPINLGSDGIVTCPTDLKIINNSAGPIQITSIKMTENETTGWKLTDFNGGDRGLLAALGINSKKLGFELTANGDTAATSTDGTQYLECTDDNWTVPGGTNMELPIGCQAISSAVTSAVTAEAAGSVTFTVGWKGTVVRYTVKTLEEVINEEGDAEVTVGDQVQLSAAAVYSLRIPTWESSDSSVVEVTSSGLATAKSPGTATVTYTLGDSSGSLLFKVSKKTLSAPAAPTMASRTSTSVTLTAVDGCEYSMDGSTWQDSPTFSDLTANTAYTFYQRYKETSSSYASASSSASISTSVPTPTGTYLTFTSPATFSMRVDFKGWNGTIEYYSNTGTWSTWDGSSVSALAVDSGDYALYFRGTGNSKIAGNSSGSWAITGNNVQCQGNIETLLDYTTVESGGHPTMVSSCYAWMFYGCTALTTAPALPATTLIDSCYECMFWNCTNLTTAPALPATKLAEGCYSGMFWNCIALPAAPALPATTLADSCYLNMFRGCTSLKLSETAAGEYTQAYRVPTSGDGTTATCANQYISQIDL